MNANTLPQALRELADRFERANLPACPDAEIDIHLHNVNQLDYLKGIIGLLRNPSRSSSGSTHWIQEEGDGVDINAYYDRALMDKVRFRWVIEDTDEHTANVEFAEKAS